MHNQNEAFLHLNDALPADIARRRDMGDLAGALRLIDARLSSGVQPLLAPRLEADRLRLTRLPYDYPYTRPEAVALVRAEWPGFTEAQFDALLDGGALRPGADKVLSILKMESVWLYAVTALDRTEAQALLRSAGIEGDFRGLLTEREAGCAVCSGTMLEKAMRRLRSQKADTVVFTGTLALVETAKKAGFRAVAVGGAAGEDEWRQMCALADYELPHYEDWLRLE